MYTTVATKTNLHEGLHARSVAAHVGGTPLLALHRVTRALPGAVRVFAKAEWFNPSGSVKDRPALGIIRAGIESGQLDDGRRLLDSTSGNMGIAYATLGASLGIAVTVCVPENASRERLRILRALGAEVVLTDPSEGSDGAMRIARRMAAEEPARYWYANQYDHAANWGAHFESTGPEIATQLDAPPTHLVAGLGTSGTLMGAGRFLRLRNPELEIVGVEPSSPMHGLEGLKHMPTAIKPGIFEPGLLNKVERVETEAAHSMVRELARVEGLFVGVSSGAAMVAALRIGAELESGTVVTVFPDAGYKYLGEDGLWSADHLGD